MVELINQTHTANIYGVYGTTGKPIGTVEIKLVGPDAGMHAYTLSGKHTRNDIKRIYRKEKRS
jgi:hypothetical protein